MCLYPKLIKNRKYVKNKKNGGVIPAIDDLRKMAVPKGCQKCIECRKQRARGWQVRLLEDVRHNTNGWDVTLTFSDQSIRKLARDCQRISCKIETGAKLQKWKDGERWVKTYKIVMKRIKLKGYDLDNAIAKLGVKRFLERWRKKHGKSVRHWLVTELGHNGTENIHLHGIIWTDKGIEEIRKHWKDFVWPDQYEAIKRNYVSERTVNYMVKYISKMDLDHKEYNSIVLNSDGIGEGYLSRVDSRRHEWKGKETIETYQSRTGHEMAMPTYLRNKIFNDEQREELWIKKLDEQIRFVCGEKIDISKSEDEYYESLEYYRRLNTKLNYGNDTTDWNRKKYEEERRIALLHKRIERANNKDGNIDYKEDLEMKGSIT